MTLSGSLLLAALVLQVPDSSAATPAAADTARGTTVTFGAFADVYYAYDIGRPALFDRPYTTQPARHNEFNANLVHVEAKLTGDRLRGRLALQAGTSVQSNYAGEPTIGAVSGPSLLRHIQEATVGVRLTRGLWVDGGIYFSPVGLEGWISRDNQTYTRSFIADFTPYYLSGARLTWEVSPRLTAQFHLVNGWQNVSENNSDKSMIVRFDWQADPRLLLGYTGWLGNEQPSTQAARTRIYNQLFARWNPTARVDASLVVDYGIQTVPGASSQHWHGGSAIAGYRVTPTVRVVGRVEHYSDRQQVLIATGTPNGFRTWGASVGVDVIAYRNVLWRTEVRGFTSGDRVWPRAGAPLSAQQGGFAVSSLAVTF